jgi:phage virion morphogenesis protein
MSDGLETFERAARRIHQMATDVKHVERPLKEAGEYIVGSVKKTILVGGRPVKFAPLAASTIAGRRKGRGRGGPKILIDRGRLLGSIQKKVTTDGVRVGTNVVYAARHHFGYPGGSGRGHSRTPARPFMQMQKPEDEIKIGQIFARHIARK